MAVLFSEYVSTQSSWYSQPYSVSQYLGSGKNRTKSPWNLKPTIWNPLMYLLFQREITDAGWCSMRQRQPCVYVCVRVHLVLLLLDWQINGLQELRWAVQFSECYWIEFCQYTLIHSAGHMVPGTISKALNIHGNACSYFKIVTII